MHLASLRGFLCREHMICPVLVASGLSGFWIRGPHVAGGSNGACFGCDCFATGGTLELCRSERVSARAADEAEAAWVAEMFRTRYFDVRIKHFHELIVGLPMGSVKPRWLHQGRRQR